jgi:hypothetical protein
MIASLCESCVRVREVVSGKGSRFLLCLLSQSDVRFPKYPPQPVIRCAGYQAKPTRGPAPGPSDPAPS